MRVQIYIIALLTGMLLWGSGFDVARKTYREAQRAELVPNLHIKNRLNGFI